MTEVSLLRPVVSLLVDQLNHAKKNSENHSGDGTSLVVSKMILLNNKLSSFFPICSFSNIR